MPLIAQPANLVLVRGFSKAFGLAGLRAGYLLADTAIIDTVKRVANPKHLTSIAQVAALAALEDWPSMQKQLEEVKSQRERLVKFLREKQVRCHDYAGNFVLFYPPEAERVERQMRERGILIRDRSAQMPGSVRITIGSKTTMDQVMAVMDDLLSGA